MDDNIDIKGPILFVMVVGFHHKKGCQIEYCFPNINNFTSDDEFQSDDINQTPSTFHLPKVWKTLPSIALPDGSHNYDRDTIFFHLPHPKDKFSTIFGVSCYRQVASDQLHNKTSDVTRPSVQKSVVVLSELPLYGLISAKCEMITFAYFNLFDFSKVDCLKELYFNLNSLLTPEHLKSNEVFLGLSPKDLILNFQYKALILFKLILLEKKVLFFKSPVKSLCTTILSLLSLFPGIIECGGLDQCSSSVIPKHSIDGKFSTGIELIDPVFTEKELTDTNDENRKYENTMDNVENCLNKTLISSQDEDSLDSQMLNRNKSLNLENQDSECEPHPSTPPLLQLPLNECGLPLEIFRKGSFCHPYLSLTYLDVLSDIRIRSFVIGATNILFKQKKSLFDVIVEIDGCKIETNENELKKQIALSKEDLRFADHIVKTITEGIVNNTKNNGVNQNFVNGSCEGYDDWLRFQFKIYLLHLLRTSECDETSKEYCSFNPAFMKAWKDTYNYKTWASSLHPGIFDVNPVHPFHGQLSISDMKLKFSQAVMNTERGKKLNQTMAQTSKAVGEVLSNAKSAVSSWWSYKKSNTNSNTKKEESNSFSSFSLSMLLKSVDCEEAEEATEIEDKEKLNENNE